VRGEPYHPLHDPYLTGPTVATMLVVVNAMPHRPPRMTRPFDVGGGA
jgi:hypothetical protein